MKENEKRKELNYNEQIEQRSKRRNGKGSLKNVVSLYYKETTRVEGKHDSTQEKNNKEEGVIPPSDEREIVKRRE